MKRNYTLGVLDLCKLFGETPDQAIWATLELAPLVESMGYSRYWLSEHHTKDVAPSASSKTLACTGCLAPSAIPAR